MGCGGFPITNEKMKRNKRIGGDDDYKTDIKINDNNPMKIKNLKYDFKPTKDDLDFLQDFNKRMNDRHWELRKMHDCDSLNINNDLNKMAQMRAEKLSSSTNEIFSEDIYKEDILGENILISNKKLEPEELCDIWYNECDKYNYDLNKFQKGTGHFTQLVWKGTKDVGFGAIYKDYKDGQLYVVVAYYFPAGNIFNEFKENVRKKKVSK